MARNLLYENGQCDIYIVTDNGMHFTEENLGKWLCGIGCRHILTAPRHPASNGIAENFVCTFKSAIGASITDRNYTLEKLKKVTDNFCTIPQRQTCHNSAQSGKTFQRKRFTNSVTMCGYFRCYLLSW